ncbi:hypothetical protein PC116_g5997 [Phytophthora cactorum]|nr:hypothetical protein PC116_g5997 [Phytophthora cactorum]
MAAVSCPSAISAVARKEMQSLHVVLVFTKYKPNLDYYLKYIV